MRQQFPQQRRLAYLFARLHAITLHYISLRYKVTGNSTASDICS